MRIAIEGAGDDIVEVFKEKIHCENCTSNISRMNDTTVLRTSLTTHGVNNFGEEVNAGGIQIGCVGIDC